MEVKLLSHTPDPERLIALAARSCVSKRGAHELASEPEEALRRSLSRVLESGHESVIEHAYFTFSIKGVSRACTHQLVRHRIASYSQQSQRYVDLREAGFVIPESVRRSGEALEAFEAAMRSSAEAYSKLLELGIPPEDARFVLPNATATNIVVTMNARELLHFFGLRCCLKAQWEIRALAQAMLELVRGVAPTIFERAGPYCLSKGICPEGDRGCPFYERYILKRC
ncbi:MAG: FAD-dependent thymidylate synthase [Candidatus Bathyarchaeia archaeon]